MYRYFLFALRRKYQEKSWFLWWTVGNVKSHLFGWLICKPQYSKLNYSSWASEFSITELLVSYDEPFIRNLQLVILHSLYIFKWEVWLRLNLDTCSKLKMCMYIYIHFCMCVYTCKHAICLVICRISIKIFKRDK